MTTSLRLWILLCVVLLLALLAVLNAGRLIDPDTSSPQPPLLDGLADQLARVQRVQITTADGVVTLEKQPSGWGIAERAGYPARISTLSELLNALALATRREAMTSRAENLGRLGLDDPEVPETGASWVEIWLDDNGLRFNGSGLNDRR